MFAQDEMNMCNLINRHASLTLYCAFLKNGNLQGVLKLIRHFWSQKTDGPWELLGGVGSVLGAVVEVVVGGRAAVGS